jgi:magnesium transporter
LLVLHTLRDLVKHIRLHLEEEPEGVRAHLAGLPAADIADLLNHLTLAESATVLTLVPLETAVAVCDQPTLRRRGPLMEQLEPKLASQILEHMAADERTHIVREMGSHAHRRLLPLLSQAVQAEIQQLLQYKDGTAGSIMTTEFVRLSPEMTVGQALTHIRSVARDTETIYACYVLAPDTGKLLGAVSLRDLVMAEPTELVTEVMRPKPITAVVDESQESVAHKISKYNLLAVPVLETDGRAVGFVTVDDVIDVMIEEQTEDVLRLGAVEPGALELPYMTTPLLTLVRKRGTWLVILFLSEMLTATAMGFFEAEIAKAVVLALFVPLVISSGGNSGSQATSLIIRALALREVCLGDWWRVMRREVYSGLALGAVLGVIGFLRIAVWSAFTDIYGPHWPLIGLTVGLSLVGIVMWGSLSGSMLPFLLKRLGFDPATSSAPFVATLVDVTGLVIYFSVAMVVLRGTLL